MTGGSARFLAGLALAGLVAMACGSQVDQALIDDARIAALRVDGPGTQSAERQLGAGQVSGPPVGGDQGSPDSQAVDRGGANGGPGVGSTDAAVPNPASPAESSTGGSPGAEAVADTRFAPPGGNGGATDIGVTETEIVIGNVADITGAVAGIFADAQKAAQAKLLHFASTEGTVWGRTIRLVPMDSALTRTGNFTAYTELCDSAFMASASMSAFDEGMEEPVSSCGIPDLRTSAVNPDIMLLPTVFGALAQRPRIQPLTEYEYWKEQFPEAIKSAGYLFVDSATTRAQTSQVRDGAATIGYDWKVYRPVDLAAISYKPDIREMKRNDVRFVTFQGAYQQAAKLAREMIEEELGVEVFALQTNIYDPRFLQEGGANLERFPVQIAIQSQVIEEIEGSPELQTYREWLKLVDPEAEPTGLGAYAWAAMSLTVKLLKQVGPDLTRDRMLEAIRGVSAWSANGLVPEQDVGGRTWAGCIGIFEVQQGAFVRVHPTEPNTFDCSGQHVDLR